MQASPATALHPPCQWAVSEHYSRCKWAGLVECLVTGVARHLLLRLSAATGSTWNGGPVSFHHHLHYILLNFEVDQVWLCECLAWSRLVAARVVVLPASLLAIVAKWCRTGMHLFGCLYRGCTWHAGGPGVVPSLLFPALTWMPYSCENLAACRLPGTSDCLASALAVPPVRQLPRVRSLLAMPAVGQDTDMSRCKAVSGRGKPARTNFAEMRLAHAVHGMQTWQAR